MKLKTFILTFLMMSCSIVFGQGTETASAKSEAQIMMHLATDEVGTITIANNISIGNTIEIPNGKKVTIDLNGHELSTNEEIYIFKNFGKLTITDSDPEGKGTIIAPLGIYNGKPQTRTISTDINYNIQLTINGGKFVSTSSNVSAAIYNHLGVINIRGGEFYGEYSAITNYGMANIENTYIECLNRDKGAAAIINDFEIEYGENVRIVGRYTTATQTGVITPSDYKPTYLFAELNGTKYPSLQAALDACTTGDNTINLLFHNSYNATVSQKEGVNITIDGNGYKGKQFEYTGTIYVNGNSRHTGTETLTIQDVNFVTTDNEHDFISCNDGGNSVIRYAHNVTVQNCNFNATEESTAVVALRFRQSYNINVVGGTFTNLHSVMWATGTSNATVDGITATNCKEGGISFGTSTPVYVKNSTIAGAQYGVRADGSGAYSLTVDNSTLSAEVPVIVRNTTGEYNLTVAEDVTLTAANGGPQVVVTAGNDDVPYVAPTVKVNVTLNNDASTFGLVAKIGNTYYSTLDEAFAVATEDQTIVLLADATPVLTSQRAITKAAVIDLNDKTLTLAEDDLYFGTTTFKNGNIVVDPSVKASTAVFWMFENQTLTFDNVNITATGVTGTYLIGINGGTGSNVNLLNGTNIIINNASQAGLSAVICDNGTGNNVKIENSEINVKNIEGRFYLGGTSGNITVDNTDIDLNGVKEGFYLRANQTLSIKGESEVEVVLNDTNNRYGINITDYSATYTKDDLATVNATVYDPVVRVKNLTELQTALVENVDKPIFATETIVISEGTLELDLNTRRVFAADKNVIRNDGATLTIKNGTIERVGDVVGYAFNNAQGALNITGTTIKGGLYTSGTSLVATNANISHFQSSRHAIYAYNCNVTLNGGTYHNDNSGNATIMAAGSSVVTIKDGTFSIKDGRQELGWTSCLTDTQNTASITVEGGTFNGGFRVQSGTTMTIEGGSFNDCYGSSYYIYGTAIVKGGTFTDANAINFAKDNLAEGYVASDNGNGTFTVLKGVAKIGDTYYATLQAAIDAVQNGETITLLSDITENVTLTEKVGLYYTINGSDKIMNGKITVNPLSDTNDNRRITISNINFVENTDTDVDFISAVKTNHYPRLTISGCNFTGSGNDGDVAVRLKSSHSVVIENCTGTGLHSFLQNTSGWNLTINNVTVTESKGGLALGTVQGVTVAECEVTTDTYGIRLDANTYNNNAVIETCTVNAFIPVVVRNVNTESSITFNGTNTMTQTNTDGLWCAIGTTEYEENGTMPTAPTGNVSVTLNDTGLNREGIYGSALNGEGTEEKPYLIETVNDLVFFRDQVNGGNNYAGKHVKLATNIDLNNKEWTPIGNVTYDSKYKPADASKVFRGVFNGNGKVISNLKVSSTVGGVDTQANVGFFGITGEGAVIKDLTLTNVNIVTDGRNVGALAGFAYKATLSNITVNGDINIEGGNNVSGVAGMTRHYAMSATNIKVVGNDGSAIVGNNIVGGIFAEIAPNGSEQTFESLSVENVAITGASGVGGIVGLLTTGAVNNVTVKNVVLTGRTDYQGNAMGRIRLGSIAGLMGGQYATIANVTTENVTAKNLDGNAVELPVIGANYDAASNATEAKIGNTYYATLQDAIDAAEDGTTTINLLADIASDVTIIQKEGVNVVIDGAKDAENNYTFTGLMSVDGNARQNGEETLTIKNINFVAKEGVNACITAAKGSANYCYSHNLTVENCTFTDPDGVVDCAAIRQPSGIGGGCVNWTVKNCSVDETMHSLMNTSNINNLVVEDCIVKSKSGLNLNNSDNVTLKGNNFDVQTYALRAGENGGTPAANKYLLENNTMKSECDGGDAVIIFRNTASAAEFSMTKNVVSGTTHISGNTTDTNIDADANYWGEGLTGPVVAGTNVDVNSYYADEAREQLIVTALTLQQFVEKVTEGNGTYNGTFIEGGVEKNITVKVIPVSGDARNTNDVRVPNRLQKYTNPEVYYAQYQRFSELTDVNISNVNFVFYPAAVTVTDAWNTAGATTTADNINGELQLLNTGSVSFANCSFEKMSVSPINATTLSVTSSTFNGLDAYAIKDIKATTATITGTTFTDCNGGFWFNNAPTTLTVTGNTFTGTGRRGAIQFSANGDYANTEMTVTDNEVTDEAAFLWQLNNTISNAQLNAILDKNNNTYETAFVEGSVELHLQGEGTADNPYLINDISDLEFFRDQVNADNGNTYEGKYIKVTATEIDLNNEEWTPIAYKGKTFKGNFDGNNVTVKNLKITKALTNSAENNGIGFFGRTDSPATIENITIENVDITGSLYVGAIVGYGYTGKHVKGCTVKGDIAIDAWWYAGVIGGNGYMNLIDNCHVIGNDGSYIKGNDGSYIGGIWGFRGEGNNKITNCTVTNLDIIGVDRVGGICGIGHYGNTISGCDAEDVTVTATDSDATTIGLLVGATQGNDISGQGPTIFEDNDASGITAQIDNGDGTYTEVTNLYGTNINGSTPVTNYVAQIVGGTQYATLAEAVAAAVNNNVITLLPTNAPIAMNASLYGKDVTITGTATVDWSKGFLFVGRGGEGNAKLTFESANLTSASNSSSYGIHVSGREKNTNNKYDGTLVINNSTIDLDYLINRGTIELDGGNLTVKNGFGIAGRPGTETESGEDATATITLNNESKVVVNNHNGMGLGIAATQLEGFGIMNINSGSTFETTQSFTVTAKGTMNVNGGNVKVDDELTNNGAVNVTGNASMNVNTLTGNAINFTNVTIANANIGGAVNAFGTNNFTGETTIGGILSLGYGTNPTEQVVVNITGKFNGTNVIVYVNNGTDNILNVGNAEGTETTAHFGQLGAFGDVNIVNADVTYGYAFIRNDFNVTNSTMAINGGTNTYFSGNAKVVVDNSSWNLSGNANIGSYGGPDYKGNAEVTLKNCSSMTATNLGIEQYDGKTVILTLKDSSTLTATNLSNTGSIVLAGEEAKVTSNELTGTNNVPTTTVADHKVVYENGAYVVTAKHYVAQVKGTDNNVRVKFETFAEALDAVENGETIELLGTEGSEISKELEFTKDIEFTITGNAPDYALPVVTFQNATVNIKDANFQIPELDARKNATINVINSTIVDAGGNSIVKSYYNGAINIDETSTVYAMQVTTMGYITVAGTLNATWQTNVYGNGLITLNEGAIFNTAALHLTAQDYSGRDNTDAGRVGKPAEIVVDGANLTIGKVLSAGGADYSYNSSKGINVGTVDGKSAILNIKNGGNVNIYMANGETTNFGAGATVNVDASTLNTICRSAEGTVTLANNGTVYVTGEANLDANVTGNGWFYMNGVTLDAGTKLLGAKVGFINGVNTIKGSTIKDGWFSVGIGKNTDAETAAAFATANGINLGDVTVNVSDNATVYTSTDAAYSGWVGSAYSAADKGVNKYILNINNSLARFGYMHVSKDGKMNVTGKTNNKYEYAGNAVDFYAGTFINNGNVTLNGVDAWAQYTKISVDHADAVLNITNGTKYEANCTTGNVNASTFLYHKAGTVNVDATSSVNIEKATTLVEGAVLNIASNKVIAKGAVTGNGTINLTDLAAKFTAQEGLTVVDQVNNKDHKVVYKEGAYQFVHKDYVAQIDEDNKFETLQEAFDAAQDGDEIVVLKEIVLTAGVTVAADKVVVLDLNGKTISMQDASNNSAYAIKNNGNLTIKDSAEGEGGKITFNSTTPDNSFGYATSTIGNGGHLTIENGLIENTTVGGASYAVDGIWHTGEASLTINDGTITATKIAVRQVPFSATAKNTVTINGGTLTGATAGLQMFNINNEAKLSETIIKGGTFNGTYAFYTSFTSAQASELATINIDGGTFNGYVYLYNGNNGSSAYPMTVTITDGNFEAGAWIYTYDDNGNEVPIKAISGGIFSVDPSDYCADNYGAVELPDGTWFVRMLAGTQTREFANAGWYWFSTYIQDMEGQDGLDTLKSELDGKGKEIKSQHGGTRYYPAYNSWTSALTSLSTSEMYMINTTDPVTVEFNGDFVEYESRTINLVEGWNWIGYPVSQELDINVALKNLQAKPNDYIKGKNDGEDAWFIEGYGWWSKTKDFKFKPGHGYMYQSQQATSFTFNAVGGEDVNTDVRRSVANNYHWNADATQYPNNMTMVAVVDGIDDNEYEVAAFVNGEVRGSARPAYFEPLDTYILVLTIHGDDVEEMTFKYYDLSTNTEYDLNNKINYSNDAIVGSIYEPYMLTRGTTGIGEAAMSQVNIYPNPTTTGTEINLEATCDKVEVFNALGVKVVEYQNVDTIDALETAGIYVIRITNNGNVQNCRLVVK